MVESARNVQPSKERSLAIRTQKLNLWYGTFQALFDIDLGILTGTAPNLSYRPISNYFGFDQFTFTASDRTATSAPAT